MSKITKIQYLPDRLEYHDKTNDKDIYAGCIGDNEPDPLTLAVIVNDWGDGKAFAERLVSCWNACLNLENPEQDLPKIIEALKDTNQTLRFSSYADGIIFKRSIELSNEALALVKE